MKKCLLLLLTLAVAAGDVRADRLSGGKWTIDFNPATLRLSLAHDGLTLMADAYAEAVVGQETLHSYEALSADVTSSDVADVFGTGRQHAITYHMAGGTELIQTFGIYDQQPYVVVRLAATGPDATIGSNRMVPLATTTQATPLPQDRKNRMLFVPWDNDAFIGYSSSYLRRDMHSYAVTSVYNSVTREGIVAGAVDHDLWKSAVHVVGSDYYKIDQMELISGYTDEHSHDSIQSEGVFMPHGTVVADTVRSARFVVGRFSDWRTGLETFGEACTKVAPRREWAGGTPYGWSSWGVMQTKISYQGVIDCADFIRDNLVPHGFHDSQGRVVLSLDAWWNDNLSDEQVKQFVAYCRANNMIPGLYYGPFCLFADLSGTVPGTNNRYRFRDLALKQHGRYKVIDGAYCLDPTHPGTKLFILNDMNKFKQWGIEYLKCDFMSNGAIEADSWYNKDCHTGIQAYNEGMAYMKRRAGDAIYLDLSISPIFPYQYTHGRRIACDAWGSIGHTQYVMNNTSYGWWLNKVYFANDPDHMVMRQLDGGGNETDGVNRARLTSGAVTGAFLTGDNFSNNVAAGYPAKSREAALRLLTNDDVNLIPRTCQSFRPVYGNADPTGTQAENFMTHENDQYVYLAIISYKLLGTLSGTMSFADLGIDPDNVADIKELWTGQTIAADGNGFKYNCPYFDARIYRIAKKNASAIRDAVHHGQHDATARVYDLQGRRADNPGKGIYIMNGKKLIVK